MTKDINTIIYFYSKLTIIQIIFAKNMFQCFMKSERFKFEIFQTVNFEPNIS